MNLSIKNVVVLLVCSVSLILVGCKKSSSPNYNINVTTSGLIGSGVLVQLNLTYDLSINTNGVSTFTTQFPDTTVYSLTVKTLPNVPPQNCVLANPNGTISGSDVTNITLTCAPVEFAYLTNSNSNTILALAVDESTGGLLQNSAPVATGANPVAFTLSPTGRYAVAVNQGDASVSSFLVNATSGLLVSGGASVATGAGSMPLAAAVDPSNSFVYVANSGNATLSGFAINSTTGALKCIGGSAPPCAAAASTGTTPSALAFATQSGISYLYVANAGSNTVSGYQLQLPSGGLSAIASVGTGSVPTAIAVTSTAVPFVYVVNSGDGTVSGYSVNSGNLLSSGAAISTGGAAPTAIAIAPTGQYAYVTNSGSNTVAAFSIGSGGALTSLGAPVATGNTPKSVSVVATPASPSGAFLYVANSADNSVSIYSIAANGTLAGLATQSIGNGPISFVSSAK